MILFDKIIQLAHQIGSALLRNEQPKEFLDSDLIDEASKRYVLDNLTNLEKIRKRNELLNQIDNKKDWKKIQNKIQTPVYYLEYLKYAAVVFFVLGTGIYFISKTYFKEKEATQKIVDVSLVKPGTDKATLVLGNGKTIILGQGNSYSSNGIVSNGKNITYNSTNGKVEYNYLTIPRGGQFSLQLADGTKVWVNSQSQLKFPNHFIKGQSRVVELVYGEAYFDVTSSKENFDANFKVISAGQEIEVLGTEFNVKAYQDETQIYTTLVEGKVSLNSIGSRKQLLPNEQSIYNRENQTVVVKPAETKYEVSWKEGIFTFRKKTLKEVMKVLSRWYDVDVVFENNKLESKTFKGVLDKHQKIEEILSILKETSSIKSYEIKNKTIILK